MHNSSPAGTATPTAAAERMTPGSRKALFAAVTGTVIEWYDYALYGAAAGVVIGPLFFHGTEAGTTIAAFATFAVGFVARPLGGLLVGYLGDRYGRRLAMLLTMLMMAGATVGIGLLPTAQSIGVLAPVLLVALRLLQGMGAGAELAGAMTIVAEFAPSSKRGLLTSFVLATPPLGISLAPLAFLGVSALGDQALMSWAWRVPFLASAVLFILAIWVRRQLEETPEYLLAQQRVQGRGERDRVPVSTLLTNHARGLFSGFLAMTGHNAVNYALAVFAISLMASEAVGLTRSAALTAVTLGSLVGVITTPVGGFFSDRLGSGRTVALGSAAGVVTAYPILLMLTSGNAFIGGLGVALGYALVITFTAGGQGAYLASLFPPRERMSGIALARECNGALVAGFTPLMLTWLLEIGGGIILPAVYLAMCCALSILAVVISPTSQRY